MTRLLLHTGEHDDPFLSDVFFDELVHPRARHHLGVGVRSHAVQTARVMRLSSHGPAARRPVLVLVYGDTNSTLVGALVASKLGIPVVHVEAGLRSYDRRCPRRSTACSPTM